VKRLWRKLPWLAAALVLTSALIYGFWPEAIRVDSVAVQRGALRVTVNDDGETRIREKYVISTPLTGQLLRVQLHAGDKVEAGKTIVAQIVPVSPSLLDVRAKAELEARLQAAEAAKMQAAAALESAQELEELARHNLDRSMKLITTKSIAQQELDEAEHQAAVSRANVRAAEFSVRVRSFEEQQAKAALQSLQNGANSDPSNMITILAPTSGTVLHVFREDMGVVPVGTALVEIGDIQDLELVMEILSTEAVRMKPGNKVEIEHWGGSVALQAIVRTVEPKAFLKVSALGVEEKRVNVIADFIGPPDIRAGIGDGFRIEARIIVDETSPDALRVASGALFRDGEGWHAFHINDGYARLTKVQVGATNGIETEIVAGLEQSDVVIVYPTDQIRDGVRVQTSSTRQNR
jgi:HlyD family secretion protein